MRLTNISAFCRDDSQVAADPLLAGVFEELLNNAAGAEVCCCFVSKLLLHRVHRESPACMSHLCPCVCCECQVYIKAPHVFGLRPHTMQKWIEVCVCVMQAFVGVLLCGQSIQVCVSLLARVCVYV